jgi:acetyl-CoA C-acetyltransferase
MKFTEPIHIVAAKRSPVGRLGGVLQSLSAVDLAVAVGEDALNTIDCNRQDVDSAIFGHVLQAGCGMNLARQVALRLHMSTHAPAFCVNMVCGSGLQAIALAAREIALGESRIVLAGGAESMSQAPYLSRDARWGKKLGDTHLVDSILSDGLTDPLLNIAMGETAERVAERFHISRAEQDRFAAQSQHRTEAAQAVFKREIAPIQTSKALVEYDEHPRAGTTIEALAKLKPAFRAEGTVTAGNASGINDGAGALLLASESELQKHGFHSRARIAGSCAVGCNPALMGMGPVGAIRQLCAKIDWNLDDVQAIEINEAFAAQALACIRELDLNEDKVNRRGGAIALGHPIGASGARLLVTLLHLMEDENLNRGIASLCIGGGMGIALAIER